MTAKRNLDVMIQDKLYQEIIRGNWEPGAPINLDEISAKYNVSRTPVQQALKRMEVLDIVRFSSKGHYSVPYFSPKEIHDIIEVRLMLELQALKDIETGHVELDFDELEDIARQCAANNQGGDIFAARQCNLKFHRRLVRQSQNRCLAGMYERVQAQFMTVNYTIVRHTSMRQIAVNDHLRLLETLKKRDFAGAAEVLTGHINGAYQKIVTTQVEDSDLVDSLISAVTTKYYF